MLYLQLCIISFWWHLLTFPLVFCILLYFIHLLFLVTSWLPGCCFAYTAVLFFPLWPYFKTNSDRTLIWCQMNLYGYWNPKTTFICFSQIRILNLLLDQINSDGCTVHPDPGHRIRLVNKACGARGNSVAFRSSCYSITLEILRWMLFFCTASRCSNTQKQIMYHI